MKFAILIGFTALAASGVYASTYPFSSIPKGGSRSEKAAGAESGSLSVDAGGRAISEDLSASAAAEAVAGGGSDFISAAQAESESDQSDDDDASVETDVPASTNLYAIFGAGIAAIGLGFSRKRAGRET